jgi:hypothetical protein
MHGNIVKKRKFKGTFLLGFLLFVVYIFIIPRNTGKELVVSPRKVIDLTQQSNVPDNYVNKDKIVSFRIGDRFGFVDSNNRLVYNDSYDYDIALSDYGFINFSSIQEEEQGLMYRNYHGEVKSSFRVPGYPTLSEDGKRIFVIKADATGITELSQEGEMKWSSSFASIITGFDAQNEYSLIGLLNGNLKLFYVNGLCLYNVALKGSRTDSVYGCALGDSSKQLGAVYGLDPQRLVFIKRNISRFDKPFIKDLDSDFRRPVFVGFDDNGKYLFIEGKNKLVVMNTDSKTFSSIPYRGQLNTLTTSPESVNTVVFTRFDDNGSTFGEISVFRPPQTVLLREVSALSGIFVKMFGPRLLIGSGTMLLILELGEV